MNLPRTHYYISSGAKNAMRTLRVIHSGPNFYVDEYICNLCRDFDEAQEKAKAHAGKHVVHADYWELNEWGLNVETLKPWEVKYISAISAGVMPFGKHKGADINTMEEGYVKYWVGQTVTNPVNQALIAKFKDIADERGYFEKWETEKNQTEADLAAKYANMSHVGKVGSRMELFLKCVKTIDVSGVFFKVMNICVDRYGNEFVYAGSNVWQEGSYYKAVATIKAHKEYKGKPQTFISRPTVKDVKEVKE